MKTATTILIAFLAASAFAADWQKQLSPPQPGTFPALRPMRASYSFGWGVFTAAGATAELSRTNELLRLDVKGGTVGVVRGLWRMDADSTALWQPDTLRPVSHVVTEVFQKKTVRLRLDFDAKGVTQTRTTRSDEAPRPQRVDFAGIFDMSTAMMWLRSQPLRAGETYRCLTIPDTSAYLTELEIVGREKLDVAGKSRDAIKVLLRAREVNGQLELVPSKRFKQAWVWLSDDSDRLLLRAKADVFIGSVWMELEKVQFRGGSS
ncbi:MAG: DUF3108 domain-containing protein [Verrucomicrobia bacterium]|nr:DUF3108 domain-containing protein [Verrucomicrobiota bacterium]